MTPATAEFAPGNPAIVSMGDSFISGEGGRWAGNALTSASNGNVWGTDRGIDVYKAEGNTSYDSGGNRCDRSTSAEIKTAALPYAVDRYNLACSGAETKDILTEEFKGEQPQINQLAALAANHEHSIRAVVVSIGGNDLKFSDILRACISYYIMPVGRDCQASQSAEFTQRLAALQTSAGNVIDRVRTTMRDNGYNDSQYELILQSYPSPLPRSGDYRHEQGGMTVSGTRYTADGCPFSDDATNWANDVVLPRITATLQAIALSRNTVFLDLSQSFNGHELCNRSANQAVQGTQPPAAGTAEWVRWVPYLLVAAGGQGDQQEAIHPNYFGQLALGSCLSGTLNRRAADHRTTWGYQCTYAGTGTDMAVDPLPGMGVGAPVSPPNAASGSRFAVSGSDGALLTTAPPFGGVVTMPYISWYPGIYPNRTTPVSRPFYPFQTIALQAGPANAPGSWYLTDYHASRYTRQGNQIGTVSAGNPNLPDDLWTFHDAGGGRFWVTNPGHDGCLTNTRNAPNIGVPLMFLPCNGSMTQKWDLRDGAPHYTGVIHSTDNCLGNPASGADAVLSTCNVPAAEGWNVTALPARPGILPEDDDYTVSNGTRCLTARSPRAVVAACDGSAAQTWRFLRTGSQLMSPQSGECLTEPDQELGSHLTLSACDGANNKRWRASSTAQSLCDDTPPPTPPGSSTPNPAGTMNPAPSGTGTPGGASTMNPAPSGTGTPGGASTMNPAPSGTDAPPPGSSPTPAPSATDTPPPGGTPTPAGCDPQVALGDSVPRAYSFLAGAQDRYAGGSTLRVPQSYTGGHFAPGDEFGPTGYQASFTYDNALIIAAYLQNPSGDNVGRAVALGDSLLYAQAHDITPDGRLRASYEPDPFVTPTGVYVGGFSVYTGNMAWAGMAFARLYSVTGEGRFLDGAVRVGNWIQNNAADSRGVGGYTGGLRNDDQTGQTMIPITWKATEHNIDTGAFFAMLARITGDQGWKQRSENAFRFVASMQADDGRLWTGTGLDGVTQNRDTVPEDIQTWSYLATLDPRYSVSVDWAATNLAATDGQFAGVSFGRTDTSKVWFEGTAHLLAAYNTRTAPGDADRAAALTSTLLAAQHGAPNTDGNGIVAASHDGLTTGEGDIYYASLHTGATAWYLLAVQGGNPFRL
ncbi:ricin-type beta-trefoil lectin domain protein [Kitasatospora griseola]|uniref:ricin-type beta-trefoil lectin domain protein n=1 Tax=Kitasatospora griseola TaxID=2064 RepID=UPI003442958E